MLFLSTIPTVLQVKSGNPLIVATSNRSEEVPRKAVPLLVDALGTFIVLLLWAMNLAKGPRAGVF
jgi:hypothetical protein